MKPRAEAPLPEGVELAEFAMGEYTARFPLDRFYCKNHMWALPLGGGLYRFGLGAYAVRLLQDVYFIDFDVAPGSPIEPRQEVGSIESKKAESGIYAPCGGELRAINPEVLEDPSAINVDPYGDGWLFEIESGDVGLLDGPEYLRHLEGAWQVAQRTIKGQANSD